MKQRQDVYRERAACPLYTAIAVIDGRWKPMIYQRRTTGALGLFQLERSLPRVRLAGKKYDVQFPVAALPDGR